MASTTYRVWDARTKRWTRTPADQMTAYERWMADESARQAYRK